MAGLSAIGGSIEKRDATLNERLNKTSDTLVFQCDRIEAVLARVNGTPQKGNDTTTTPVAPTMSLTNVVEKLETLTQRLAELADGVGRIA